jgi:hypothetical protein
MTEWNAHELSNRLRDKLLAFLNDNNYSGVREVFHGMRHGEYEELGNEIYELIYREVYKP